MKNIFNYIILIRLSVGLIFISEGIQKFIFNSELGVGRFSKIEIPFPELSAPIVALTEILFGFLILIGFKTKYSSIPIFVIMMVAITVTKISTIPAQGFWSVAHGARTDFAMLLSSLFLILSGSGKYSIDEYLKIKNIKN